MAYLGPTEIKARLAKDLKITPAPPTPTSWDLDLHMGKQAFLSSADKVTNLKVDDAITILPGEFGLLLTEEHIEVPANLVGFISVKFSWKAKGLTNVSGFHVDPAYKGNLMFSVYNAGPRKVIIKRGDAVFMMGFSQLSSNGPPRNPGFDSIPTDFAMAVAGEPVSVLQMDQRLRKLEEKFSERRALIRKIGELSIAAILGGLATFLVTRYLL